MPLTSEIADYDSDASDRFVAEAAFLKETLQDDLISIHHIGSTAVPGLKAKPEIDMLVILRKADRIEDHLDVMQSLGYEPDGETQPGNWYYQKDTDGRRSHKAHVCKPGHEEIWRYLLFRDYLVDHPERAQMYGDLKLALQKENVGGMREYLDGKERFILETIELAVQAGYEKPLS